MKNPTTLMVQGTTSDAGKSLMVTALCRIFHRHGASVAPFKPQNMALNSCVTAEGGEIGRAQAVQAEACCLAPHVDMNPVLLKPQSNTSSQIIVLGKVAGNLDSKHFNHKRDSLLPVVLEAHERLVSNYGYVMVEGAGSPAEVNLRKGDIANMGFAEEADCPVVIVVDIDKGGAYAHLLGTFQCLSATEQARIKGFIINKFRGDQSLLDSANQWLLERTGVPIVAVVPYVTDLYIEAEDAVDFSQTVSESVLLNVVVVGYPHMSNHTDFDALRLHPEIHLVFSRDPQAARACDLIILPGSKAPMMDLSWLREREWDVAIDRHLRYGGKVLGICGGFQILGRSITDPEGIEGLAGSHCIGLGKLDIDTVLQNEKMLRQVDARCVKSGIAVRGYEIHVGVSTGPDLERPLLQRCVAADASYEDEGAQSADGQVAGCYLHGLFDSPDYLSHIAAWAGQAPTQRCDLQVHKEREMDRLADAVEQAWPYESILSLMNACK